MVLFVPVPVIVLPPGNRVNVHVPLDGKPDRFTLPTDTSHVGWVTVPTEGAAGVGGWGLITASSESPEVQPAAFLTVKV